MQATFAPTDEVRESTGMSGAALPPGRRGPLARREERLAFAMLTPVLLALFALGLYPAITTVWYSLQTGGYQGINTSFAGFANYTRLFHDPLFWSSLRFSLLFSIITVSGQMILGTALALFANAKFPGRWVLRAAILFPWAIPTATNSVIWAYMFNYQYGLFNSILIHLHVITPATTINWLGGTMSATVLIYIIAIWKANSLVALLVLAGLQSIPDEIYEAARVDGATYFQTLWRVTLPLLRPTLIVALIVRIIESLQAFDIISAFTNGSPGTSTQNLGLYIYSEIGNGDFGYSSTIATVVMVLTVAFIFFYLRTLTRSASAR